MMRATSIAAMSATRVALVGNGLTFPTGGENTNENYWFTANAHPMGNRNVRSSSVFPEPNTAIYDGYLAWTYFQPLDIKIDTMAAPEAKHYQRHTKRPWDVSCTELVEIQSRRRYLQLWWYSLLLVLIFFLLPKEKSFSGLRGPDGHYIMLPKNQPEKF